MRTTKKMKDYSTKFEEWWEVVKEYFAKKMEKNLAQHRINERILRYKLEIYHKIFPEFVYGSLTSTETLTQDEEAQWC